MSIQSLSLEQLKEIISIKEQIAGLESKLVKLIGGKAPVQAKAPKSAPVKKKGGMSAEGRARIIAAQKARWAKVKGTASAKAAPAPAKKARKAKRKLSAEGRARIVAALKARWAAKKSKKA